MVMRLVAGLLWGCAAAATVGTLWAGGSGLNVIVVVNQNSTNSVQLGNDYCELRGVPPQNVLRMTGWTAASNVWSLADFEARLRAPLLAMPAARALTNLPVYVLLSMDIPYTVLDNGSYNSTTAALFYGFKTNTGSQGTCSLPAGSFNSYAFSEMPFAEAWPDTAVTNCFLAMMLTDKTLASAESILARSAASDSTFPTQAVYLAKSSDAFRNIRFVEFDNAILASRIRGENYLIWTNTDSTSAINLLGLETGLGNFSLPANAFVPGAMGDSLTSYGGILFENTGQATLLAFLRAGAAGSYGTVVEPCNYTQKFPDPRNYVYQHRGFCLAEAYYQSVENPHQGLLVGEPLAAPFARPGTADWSSLTDGAVLTGQALLTPTFLAAATNLPLGRVDFFLDGSFLQTVTNVPPAAGNLLSVTLNGSTANYTVPANATVASVVTGLVAALNARTNTTHVQAWAVGDRLELQSLSMTVPASNVSLSASAGIGSGSRLTTFLNPAQPTFLELPATGRLQLAALNTPAVGDWLKLDVTKTNGARVTVSVTNIVAGTKIGMLVSNLVDLVNGNAALQGADGIQAGDIAFYNNPCCDTQAEFMLYAQSPGWPASQVQVAFTSSPNLRAMPGGANRLQDNLNDLRPRNHLYVSSGAVSLPVSFALDTTQFPDGFHQLTAVAYEGTSVRTQTRVARNIRFQNTPLSATITPLVTGTNVTLDLPLQFTVSANASRITRIELFSTGMSVGVVSNQSSVTFTAPSATLGLGLHPFYALVTGFSGNRYRTETVWIRLIPPFQLSLSGQPLKLSWPAVTGLRYDILAAGSLADAFQTVTSLVASNSVVQWPIPAPANAASFYRVSLSP